MFGFANRQPTPNREPTSTNCHQQEADMGGNGVKDITKAFIGAVLETHRTSPRFLLLKDFSNTETTGDMDALMNAHSPREHDVPPCTGLTSDALPEAQRSQTGVSSEYVHKANHQWFVLRVTYNRSARANKIIENAGVISYTPMHYAVKYEIGKKRRIKKLLLPNLIFVYATREVVETMIRKKDDNTPIVKYYLDKTKPLEPNGKHPPLTISDNAMNNFIRATSTNNDHVRIVSSEQCHFKSGDFVRVIGGEFEGIIGNVARIAGQQRVVVEMQGLCMVATAYVPSTFIETIR